MKLFILHGHENITYKFINCDKGERNMKKLLHAHEFCLTIISHASFSEREGDLGLTWNVLARHGEGRERGGEGKRERERERGRKAMLDMLFKLA